MIVVQKTLDELKEDKIRQVKQKRKQLERSVIIIKDGKEYTMNISPTSRANLQGVIQAYELGILNKEKDRIAWKFRGGNFVALSYEELLKIAKFVFMYVEQLFGVEKEKIAEIKQLQTREEVKNYVIENKWINDKFNLDEGG